MELLVVVVIIMSVAAISLPILGATMRDVRLQSAVSRIKAGLQQTRAILTDYSFADQSNASPPIFGAIYGGTALVLRWDDVHQDYEVFYALSNQRAVNASLVDVVAPTVLAQSPGATNPNGYLAPAGYAGYAQFAGLEPMNLGPGLRVAGLRVNQAGNDLELVPSPSGSFAVCFNATGVGIPPAAAIYVNMQKAPIQGGTGAWSTWDTTMYDDASANTGAYAATYADPYATGATTAGKGEGFLTSLPMVIVYRDDDLPLSGKSPSGVDWRASPGASAVNPALPPNELLVQTRGRIVMMTMQGGSPAEY